ncbi:TPA: site-specific integrase [Pseudomonas aeruginosa]|nr:site-specific integrase [Pseudomonas aeruginosa]AWT34075.1 site-specific integrase [Pseudomonas aeruginosa]AXZ95555.1 site-specific integrase [Pseudomonas aeruginosa]EJD6680272.1 site-specific integrase [Pseudomonas aeruginosa]EKC1485997.1 site-specific integrase [Pseudomonas aeruginosa]
MGGGDRRYTRAKLRSYLFHQIVADTQDVAAASMLSGVEIPSAQTPRYYLQLDACHLRKIYTTSLVRVLTQVYACAGLAYEYVDLNPDQQGGVGATHCLLPATIASNISAMARVLRRKANGRLSEMVAWHNCFTLWTVQMFMLVTSCRAVRNPLMLIDEFDSVLGMGALSDKDSDDRHMSRLICMPPMLRRQITSYFAHCASISRQLIGYLPQDEEDHQWSRGFFLQISQAGIHRVEIAPSNIYDQMELVSGYTTHRVNAYRKFTRTELTERGCPSEALAAFMGHWLRGEEPQDAYSTFCPAVYAKVLDEWITPLLKELGWSALSSQWVTE